MIQLLIPKMNKISKALNRASKSLEPHTVEQDVPDVFDVERIANKCIQKLVPLVRSMLVKNYSLKQNQSKDKRGQLNLLTAVANAVVWCKVVDGRLILRWGLASGQEQRVYEAAGALEYGSVTTPTKHFRQVDLINRGYIPGYNQHNVLGARAKKTIKKSVQNNKDLSKRSSNFHKAESNVAAKTGTYSYTRDKGSVNIAPVGQRSQTQKGSTVLGGGVVVRPPKKWFFLTDTDIAEIKAQLDALILLES
jgi:hypothetical protein